MQENELKRNRHQYASHEYKGANDHKHGYEGLHRAQKGETRRRLKEKPLF
jgi:hypothetical protein